MLGGISKVFGSPSGGGCWVYSGSEMKNIVKTFWTKITVNILLKRCFKSDKGKCHLV